MGNKSVEIMMPFSFTINLINKGAGIPSHEGTIELQVCQVTNPSVDPTNDCFNRNPLRFANGQTVMQFDDAEIVNRDTDQMAFVYSVQLPENLVCNHCLFQVRK